MRGCGRGCAVFYLQGKRFSLTGIQLKGNWYHGFSNTAERKCMGEPFRVGGIRGVKRGNPASNNPPIVKQQLDDSRPYGFAGVLKLNVSSFWVSMQGKSSFGISLNCLLSKYTSGLPV